MTDQWVLNRSNFAGCWQGPGTWFGRDGSDRLDLTSPQRVIDPTTYVIRFSDADHGVWDGSGLPSLRVGKPPTPSIGRVTTLAADAGNLRVPAANPACGLMRLAVASAMRSISSKAAPVRCWCCSGSRVMAPGGCRPWERWPFAVAMLQLSNLSVLRAGHPRRCLNLCGVGRARPNRFGHSPG